jgi:hypothetical protein
VADFLAIARSPATGAGFFFCAGGVDDEGTGFSMADFSMSRRPQLLLQAIALGTLLLAEMMSLYLSQTCVLV